MSYKLTQAYLAALARMETAKERHDRGQGSLEYIGVLAVVAVVIGVATTAFTESQDAVTDGVEKMIKKLLDGGE